jgi:hypothetical protein
LPTFLAGLPDIAAALGRGEYPSARAAGIAAGFVKVPTPLDELRKAWKKATPQQQETFANEFGDELLTILAHRHPASINGLCG